MNTRSVNSAAGVIMSALSQNRTAAGIALALESAGLLMSPEAAADMASVSTDAAGVAEQAVKELRREHEISAELRRQLESARVDGQRLIRSEQRTAELEVAIRTHRKDDQAQIDRMKARVAELLAERHSTNEALADITVAERSAAKLGALLAPDACPQNVIDGDAGGHFFKKGAFLDSPTACVYCGTKRPAAPEEDATPRVQAMRALLDGQRAAVEDPHDGPLHHSYRVGRDLPEREDPARCLEAHTFSPRDGWRMICSSCDHGKDASCHQVGA